MTEPTLDDPIGTPNAEDETLSSAQLHRCAELNQAGAGESGLDALKAAMREGVADGRQDRTDVLTFDVRKTRMAESNGRVTFSVHIERSDRPADASIFDSTGTMTAFSSAVEENVDSEIVCWSAFLDGRFRQAEPPRGQRLIHRELADDMLTALGAVTDEDREALRQRWKQMIQVARVMPVSRF